MSAGEEAVASKLSPAGGRLALCPTPIGNLGDVTLRVLEVLRDADAIACEDTRRTSTLLRRYEIDAKGRLVSLHEHNERARTHELVRRIGAGELVALVTDAGTPLVSDPGHLLVQGCIAAGLVVEALPGASSVITALVASGLPSERWGFVGFLPRRRAQLAELLAGATETLVAFESPARLAAALGVLAELEPERGVVVCRELTKLHEEVRRGSAAELAAHYREHHPRGEIVLVVGAAPPGGASRKEALEALRALVEAGARARPAAGVVAALSGVSANELYRALTGS